MRWRDGVKACWEKRVGLRKAHFRRNGILEARNERRESRIIGEEPRGLSLKLGGVGGDDAAWSVKSDGGGGWIESGDGATGDGRGSRWG